MHPALIVLISVIGAIILFLIVPIFLISSIIVA